MLKKRTGEKSEILQATMLEPTVTIGIDNYQQSAVINGKRRYYSFFYNPDYRHVRL